MNRPNIFGNQKYSPAKAANSGRDRHHQMEMRNDEIGILQLNVGRRGPEEDSAQAAADEHRHESYGEQARQP